MPKSMFAARVIKLALGIPPGRVTTYGRIARSAGGGAMAAQSITSVLAKAAASGVKGIPFHRIVYADGRIWVSDAHRAERMARYREEGIRIDDKDRVIGFEDLLV